MVIRKVTFFQNSEMVSIVALSGCHLDKAMFHKSGCFTDDNELIVCYQSKLEKTLSNSGCFCWINWVGG